MKRLSLPFDGTSAVFPILNCAVRISAIATEPVMDGSAELNLQSVLRNGSGELAGFFTTALFTGSGAAVQFSMSVNNPGAISGSAPSSGSVGFLPPDLVVEPNDTLTITMPGTPSLTTFGAIVVSYEECEWPDRSQRASR